MSETCRGHLWDKIIIKFFASSWYIFLTYVVYAVCRWPKRRRAAPDCTQCFALPTATFCSVCSIILSSVPMIQLSTKCMTFPKVALVSNSKFLLPSVAPVRFLMWSPLDNVKCVTVSQRASRPFGDDVCRCNLSIWEVSAQKLWKVGWGGL